MNKSILIIAATLGALGIIIGAFAAHGLKPHLTTNSQQAFETAVRYQMYHALFLLFIGSTNSINVKSKKVISVFTLTGIILFSGSIYLLSTNTLTAFNFKVIGFVTPIGGLLLIISWILLLINFIKMKHDKL